MSSHREAPEVSKDPVVDSTDVYAFVSPDRDNTLTIIANYIPLQHPAAGPNFFEFGDDVVYKINIDNDGDGVPDVVFNFRFQTQVRNPNTFLYNTGPITSLDSPSFNRPQTYSVERTVRGKSQGVLADNLPCPPCNVGIRSTPDYPELARLAVRRIGSGIKVFAGQRLDPFFVDLGSIFDLGALRPFQHLHLIPSAAAAGVNALQAVSVHTIALQIPMNQLTRSGRYETDAESPDSVLGIYTSAQRQRGTLRTADGDQTAGPWVQVSRLGNPLFNEVLVPMAEKDAWNRSAPSNDVRYEDRVLRPELASLLPVLYPAVFPNLAAYDKPRADLHAILMTGIPAGIVPGFSTFTGATPADLLRVNMAIPPTKRNPNPLGVIGGDPAGFPNGRRVFDDVVSIELRAIAGATIPLVDPGFTPDGAASLIADGTAPSATQFLPRFPYLGHPVSGYDVTPLSA